MRLFVRKTEGNTRYKMKMVESCSSFCLSMRDIQTLTKTLGEPYTGEYDVTPSFENQELQTADRYLAENVTVEAIEVSIVSNLSGGKTVYIGGIFDG